MTQQFGNRGTFAIEIGTSISSELRGIDVWAAGVRWTCDDNVGFTASTSRAMRSTAARVLRGEVAGRPFSNCTPAETFWRLQADETDFRERFWFMQWGETIDNVSRYAYRDGDGLVIMFAFWRPNHPVPAELGRVFVATVSAEVFATTVVAAADLLDAEG